VTSAGTLARLEKVTGRSGAAARIEALLPAGARRRQLRVRTLLIGMLLALGVCQKFCAGGGKQERFRRPQGVAVTMGRSR